MKMEFKVFRAEHNGLRFEIEEDLPLVGAYLYVFEGETVLYDFLQNTIDICKEQALEEFSVPQDAWVFEGTRTSETDIPFLDNYLPPNFPL